MKLPNKVNFDICTYCNHQCSFCSNPDERTLKSKVNKEQFIVVMDNIIKYLDIQELGLSAKGEVLLNKDLIEIVKLAKNKYKIPYVYISTNGALLTNNVAEELLNANIDSIKFSINGYDNLSYKQVHKKDDFSKVIKNFENLLKLKKEIYPELKLFVSSIIDKDKNFINDVFKDLFNENYTLINGLSKYDITYTPKFDNFKVDMDKIKSCSLVFNEIYIDADCRLGLCCKDYFKEFDYGSLIKYDFKELYYSKDMVEIRQMHIEKSFPNNHICKNCLIFESSLND